MMPLWRIGAWMFVAMTCIVGGDTAAKLLSAGGESPLFVAWTRFALAGVVLLPFMGLTRADRASLKDPLIYLRAALIAGGICCILTSLRTEPIANAFGAFFVGPIVAYALAVVVLKEQITWARTVLLALSFGGVLLVVKPGFGLTPGIGFALLAGCLHGAYLTTTRAAAPNHRPRVLLISQLLIGTVLLAPLGLTALPETLSRWDMILLALSAGGSALGNLILVTLSKTTDSSVTAPLVYLQLISATAFGYLIFDDWPDTLATVGLVVILITGLGGLALARRR